ncbi:hypothetical protein SHIRM173S_00010 [Streptomyces hirsutus]
MSSDRLMRIRSAEFQAMAERVLRVTELTSRLNVLPFEDEAGKAELFEQILGKPLPPRVTIYPPFYTDHGLNLHAHLAERVFINQNCTFLDYAGIRLGERVMIGPARPRSSPAATRLIPRSGGCTSQAPPSTWRRMCGSVPVPQSCPASASAVTPWLPLARSWPMTFRRQAW